MKPLGEFVEDFRDIENEARRKQLEIQTELEQAQHDIAKGKDSTGSPLHDGIIVLHGKDLLLPDTKIEANYEKVAEELKGKTGEPVVMIHRWIEHDGCSGFGGKLTPAVRKTTTLGVVSEEELIFDYEKGICILPTSSQASSKRISVPDGSENGLIVASRHWTFGAPNLGTDLGRKLHEGSLELSEISMPGSANMEAEAMVLAIGHDGIEEWLTENDEWNTANDFSSVRQLCEEPGIEPIEPATERQKHIALDTK